MTTMKLPFDGKYIEPPLDVVHEIPTEAEIQAAEAELKTAGPAPSPGRVPPGILARVHDEWVLAWADKTPAPGPDDGVDASAFHVDLNASAEAMADFDRRLAEAMKAPR